MQRRPQEIEARALAVLASSFVRSEKLSWANAGEGRYRLEINALGEAGKPILFVRDYEGSALLMLDGSPYYSLDGYHNYVPLKRGKNLVEAIFSPYRAFGDLVEIRPGIPYLVEVAEDPYLLYLYVSAVGDLISSTSDEDLKQELTSLVGQVLNVAYFDGISPDQAALASYILKRDAFAAVRDLETQTGYESVGYRKTRDISRYGEALSLLKQGLEELTKKYGKRGTLIAIAHAHIDAAWLWPFEESRRKVARTFSTVLSLMNEHDFTYIQSSALYYKWIKEDYPQVFEQIREKVKQGKWILGAGWVEPDANMISGESFARHFLYSQRFYLSEFGRLADVFWLPDTFGFCASIPQIAKLGGASLFATHKVFWNDTNKFPYSHFSWIGIDGTSIPAFAFGNGRGGYNSTFDVKEVLEQWQNNPQKSEPLIYSYGYGDGGGGPTPEMLVKADAVNRMPLLPRVKKQLTDLGNPTENWRGELYLETHRGTLTSHSLMKKLHSRAEAVLREAELWSTLAGIDGDFQSLWEILLKDEFHDVLPGSAIRPVYEQVYAELENVIEKADAMALRAMRALAGEGKNLVAFNSLNWEREEFVEVDDELEKAQRLRNGKYVAKVRVPSVGFTSVRPLDVKVPVTVAETQDQIALENGILRVAVRRSDGSIYVFDKEKSRTAISSGNRFVFYENIPGWADAWDIEPSYKLTSFQPSLQRVEVAERGPLVASVALTFSFRNSRIEEVLELRADSGKMCVRVKPIMRDRELLLKLWFDADVNAEKATSEIPFGNVERPTTRNNSWETAKFEVPMLRWTDVSDGGYGVALLAESKHGIAVEGTSMGLSLSKTPIYPDPLTDVEDVETTLCLYPHAGGWREALVHRAAYELSYPVRVIRGGDVSRSLLTLDDEGLIVEALKAAEDGRGRVVRVYDALNRRGRATLSLLASFSGVISTDLLELNQVPREMTISKNSVSFAYKNFEIVTLKLLA
ncbi:glycoside hydrolase family 38 C-terminal domain-containing protein [Tardisphaera miroshnichenkoae]